MDSRRRGLLAAPFVLVLLLVLLAGCRSGRSGSSSDAAPALTGTSLSGDAFDLHDQSGHWTVVAFQASTCVPCTEELPIMVAFAAAHPDVRLVSVGLAETPQDFSSFLGPYGITWPAVPDRDGSISERWQVEVLPVTVLVDPDGNVRRRWTGVVDAAELGDATA